MMPSKKPGAWTTALTSLKARRALALVVVTALAVLAVPSVAQADTVTNTVTAAGENSITKGGTTSIGYVINNTNSHNSTDTQDSCNPAGDTSPATLTVTAPAAVTVTPASRTYIACGTAQYFDFTSNTVGTYSITVSVQDAGVGTYSTSGATFTLTVKAPLVTNTAPTVTISAVTNGAAYEFGNVPVARCNVTDKEDGNSSFDASLSAITGPRATEGLGDQTATCDYTDTTNGGGLNAKASATYSIVDTSKPLVTVVAPAPTEATGALTPVDFQASAYDAVDGNLPVTCKTADGTVYASGGSFPVGTTTLTCSATDEAGNTGTSDPFNVVVTDTTAPVVTTPANIVVGNDAATVTYTAPTATDIVDGTLTASCLPDSGTTFALGTTPVTCSAIDTAGNTGTITFTVEVQDVTKPIVTVPADKTVEATDANGATVTYSGVSAEDDVDGTLTASCLPASDTVFPLGTTPVTCSAIDAANNKGTNSFTITVSDTKPPVVTVPENITKEATSADGATASFSASASDAVDGSVATTCVPVSGSTFELGVTTVICTAIDAATNEGTNSFTVTVVDTTEPDVHAPANLVVGNTSGTGADNVIYTGATADDLVSGTLPVTCTPASGSTFPLGINTVTCTATDAAGNTGTATFTIEVQDQTKPEVTVPADIVEEATGPNGATVNYFGVNAIDDVDGPLTATCSKAAGTVFPFGTTTVTCSATDKAGNKGDNTFTVTVQDTLAPNLTVSANKTATATSANGATVTYTAPTAVDIVDGSVAASCDKASGSVFPLGTTTVTCKATDAAGNIGEKQFTVTVTAAWSNVLQPINVDGSSIFKLGSTVPVKFQLTGASAGINNLVARLYIQWIGPGGTGSDIEAISTSNATTGNLFRYDATAGQYIFNLGTKTLSTGTYRLRIDLGDGVLRTVNITLK